MIMTHDYAEQNAVKNIVNISQCYLCGERLTDDIVMDHVIPSSLFKKGSPNRPKLPVHDGCNNAKSKDDEWFIRHVSLLSGLNEEAFSGLEKFISKAEAQKMHIGKDVSRRQIHELKLAQTLLDKNTWGYRSVIDGETLHLLNIGEDNVVRSDKYIKQICRGLYLLNVPGSNPTIRPKLAGMQFVKGIKDGSYESYKNSIVTLIQSSTASGFSQEWPDRIIYHGSRVSESQDKGYLYIEFYGEVGYLAGFGF
jgi:hypothetical protein